MTTLATSSFDYAKPKIFWSAFNFCESAKNQFIPSVHSSNTVNFKVTLHDWSHPFLTMSTPKNFKLIFIKLYQHAKNKLIPLFNSILESSDQIGYTNMLKMILFHQFAQREIVHLKILQSDWLTRFRSISQEQDFSQRICAGTQQIKNFHIE